MEFGIGPDCRGLDNALLAKLYPSDIEKTRAIFNEIDLTLVAPFTLEVINTVYGVVFGNDAAKVDDWREEVKRIEWALSFPENNFVRPQLTSVVAALGYAGLAALWNGEAKTGKTLVTYDGALARIFVQAPRGKAGNAAFRAILGRKFHSQGTVQGIAKPAWSFPAKQHALVFDAICKHYPINQGLNDAVLAASVFCAAGAKPLTTIDTETHAQPGIIGLSAGSPTVYESFVGQTVATPAPAPAPKFKCSMAKAGALLKVTTPYKADYVNDLKGQLKWSDRRWNSVERCWEVPLAATTTMKELVQKHFGETPPMVEQ